MACAQHIIENKTAVLYGDLFGAVADTLFFDKARRYLSRIDLNKDWFIDKVCLDAGCGNGVASYSLAQIAGAKIFSVDVGVACLSKTVSMLRGFQSSFFARASVCSLPFKDAVFDFINCNGVLHHLLDLDRALDELWRVLKRKGKIFIGVYGAGGILNEHKINFYRIIAKIIPYRFMKKFLIGKHKLELLDNLYVPVRRSFSEQDMYRKLYMHGFKNIQRISADFYRRPEGLLEKIKLGRNGMYMHFIADK